MQQDASAVWTGASDSHGKVPLLSGEPRTDWALWSLSLVLREIAARQEMPTQDGEVEEVAE